MGTRGICYIYLQIKDKRILVYWYYTQYDGHDVMYEVKGHFQKITWPATLGAVLDHMERVYPSEGHFSTDAEAILHITLYPCSSTVEIDFTGMKYMEPFESHYAGVCTGRGGDCYLLKTSEAKDVDDYWVDFRIAPEWREIRVIYSPDCIVHGPRTAIITSDDILPHGTARKYGEIERYDVRTLVSICNGEEEEEITVDGNEIFFDGYVEKDKIRMRVKYETTIKFVDERDRDDFVLAYRSGELKNQRDS